MAQRSTHARTTVALSFLLNIMFAQASGAAVCDGNKSITSKKDGLTFTSCYKSEDASPTKNLLEISGNYHGARQDIIVNAADLSVADKACEIPCLEMDNPDSAKCTGECSYGWPAYLGFDSAKNTVFFYVANSGGDTQNFTIFSMDLKKKAPKVLGKSSAAKLLFYKVDAKHLSFRAVQFKQSPKDATIEQLDVQ